MYHLHILKATGRLTPYEAQITELVANTLAKVETKLPPMEVDIVVTDSPGEAIPEIGLGGFSPNAHSLLVYTDPSRENFAQILTDNLPSTVAHELHHCARWKAIGYGTSLLHAIVSEGLADHFDVEITGKVPMWATNLSEQELEQLKERVTPLLDEPSRNNSGWLFGSKELNIPRWTGYSLGYKLVGDYLKQHNLTASKAASLDAKLFW